MRAYYIKIESKVRPHETMRFTDGKGSLTIYDSVNSAMKDVHGDKLDGFRWSHDIFTFTTSVDSATGIVTVVEEDNRDSEGYSDPGIVRTTYRIIPIDIPFEVA